MNLCELGIQQASAHWTEMEDTGLCRNGHQGCKNFPSYIEPHCPSVLTVKGDIVTPPPKPSLTFSQLCLSYSVGHSRGHRPGAAGQS